MTRSSYCLALAVAASGCVALNDYSQFSVRDGGPPEQDARVELDAGPRCQADTDCGDPTPMCDVRAGRCVVCPSPDRAVDRLEPIVHVLVPSGGSVLNPFGPTGATMWQALQELFRAPGGPLERLQFSVRFGVTVYTGEPGLCPITNTVPPMLGNNAAIQNAVLSSGPGTDIPLADVLNSLNGSVVVADPAGVAYVHLVANVPDTCAVPAPNMGEPEALASTSAALQGYGIRSFAIGLSDLAVAFTPQLAATGDTGTRYWEVRDSAALHAAFEEALRLASPCRVALTVGTFSADPCDATVTLGGIALTCNDLNGWRPVDATTFELLGAACTQLQNDATLVPTVSVTCPAP